MIVVFIINFLRMEFIAFFLSFIIFKFTRLNIVAIGILVYRLLIWAIYIMFTMFTMFTMFIMFIMFIMFTIFR